LSLLRGGADEREARFGIPHLAQVRRAFGHDDFEGGPDVPFAKMPGFGAAVVGADDYMNM